MIIKKDEFLQKLNLIKSGISSKDNIQYANYFIFNKNEIITFNTEISIGIKFDSKVCQAVPADELLNIINKIKTEDIGIEFSDGLLNITAGKITAQLKCLQENISDFISCIRPTNKKLVWEKLPDDFFEGLQLTVFSCSSDASKQYLTCLNIQTDSIISSDNLRISRFYFKKEKINTPFLLLANAAKELLKFKTITQYSFFDSWIFFKNKEGLLFCCRKIELEYPEVKSLFNVVGDEFEFPKQAIEAISTASIFSDGDYDFEKKVHVSIKNKELTCKGEKEVGWIMEKTKINIKYNLNFNINPFFFLDILKHTNKAKISDNVILFYSDNFQHIISIFHENKK